MPESTLSTPAVRTHDHMADTTNVDRFISPSQLPNETPAPSENRKRPATQTYAEIAASGVPQHARPIIGPRPDRANRQAAALFHVPDPGRIVFAPPPILRVQPDRSNCQHGNTTSSATLPPAAIDRTRLLIGHSTLPYLEWSLQVFVLFFSWPTC